MSTGSSTQPATYPDSGPQAGGSSPETRGRRGFPRLRDARIRSKLAMILLVPLLAVLALATVRLFDVGGRAFDAAQVEDLTRLSADLSDLTQVMHKERMAAAEYLATPTARPDGYNAAIAQTDSRIDRYTASRDDLDEPPPSVATQLNRIDDHLRTMDATRSKVASRDDIAVSEVVLRYGVVITDLVGYGDVLSQFAGDGAVADGLRALSAFTRAKAGTADQEAISYAARASGDVSAEQQSAFIATQTSQQEALLAFSLVASPGQRALVDRTVTGDAVNLADQISLRLSRSDVVAPAEITQAFGAVVDLMRWAEQRLEARSVEAARDESASVTRQATIESVLVLLVLILAVALAVMLARSLNLSLRRLREGALAVANRDLPDAVARLRDVRNLGEGAADDIVRQVRDPIQLKNRDEVGQVAQAFNVVHREAVRIAAEQAALRTSVSAMFLNLARRSQSLVDRMIGELDQIERGEEDPKRLAQLFELDHLATRMRRNDENLLVLAGADSSAPRREDALLVDALRAAQSEVELYNRIEFGTVDTDISITALAVNDVVRLVAELLDNATRFSPPNTVVVADGRRIRDYVVIQVEDRGLGMSEEQMDQLNRRLSEPPSVDVAAFRLMGLAVVGRLSSRYGIRVELRANIEGGTVAQVTLPSSIVVLPNRPIDPPRSGRTPQLDSGPSGGWDALPAGRNGAATATLPAIAPEPWDQRQPAADDPNRSSPSYQEPYQDAPYPEPYQEEPYQERPAHPALPQMPSQRPAGLPPLPKRGEPVPAATADRPPLPTRAPQQPETPVPAAAPGASAFASPTVAYPVVQPAASPDLQVAVGFVTPDGKKIPPPPPPVSPNPSGWGAALAAMPAAPPVPTPTPAEERAEAPIFLQMQASWFKGHDGVSPEDWTMPTAGYAPPPTPLAEPEYEAPAEAPAPERVPVPEREAPPARTVPAARTERAARPTEGATGGGTGQNGARPAPAGPDNGGASVPRPRTSAEDSWRTAADEGWQRAMAAAEPAAAGTTRSGLPKRVPQAQLVPGGVQTSSRNQQRRSPDEVRGLLSAYHRGVQRGRTAGSAEAASSAPGPKENEL
ncbi:sensor histidine kinase [Jidongwangia harbinensis]|uniref:sensor histidine kinase n=1 Tax=Jidongwangia harbinensis TaxID=2878561 RepID=UPI001CD9FFAF|nr:nitrate- and nitrite sensing domain-containing protein [Jidongwangia harbinensis]MCA2212926.1 nitrate- and nitrite sensing domain-containing protein [Jidongwangia harbinensis]